MKRRRFEDEDGGEGQADTSDVGSDLRDRLADPQFAEIGIEPKPVPLHFSSFTQVYGTCMASGYRVCAKIISV